MPVMLSSIVFAAQAASAQSAVLPRTAACERRILGYATERDKPAQRWTLSISSQASGSVDLFGAEHRRDPKHPQFARIAAAFAAATPTLALFEGPDRGLASSAQEAITTQGESGYLRLLAGQASIPARSLEPNPVELIATVRERFDGDQLVLFFVLREVARLRDREGLSGSALDAATATLLAKTAALAVKADLAASIQDIPTLAAAARRFWPDRDWRTLPSAWFVPGAGPAEARFLPAVNSAVSSARDLHLYRLVTAAIGTGERVFVVIGRDHVPMVADAIKCAIEPR